MIIVKTKSGDRFINDKAVTTVAHDREKAVVNAYGDKALFFHIEDVELVQYTNDAEPTSWKDEGSEVQRLKAELEKMQKDRGQAWEHFGYMRECFLVYHNALMGIADVLDSKAEPSSKVATIRLFSQEAEKKYEDANARFEKLRAKWEDE